MARELPLALAEAGALPDGVERECVKRGLEAAAERVETYDLITAQVCLNTLIERGGRGAEIARKFADALKLPPQVSEALNETPAVEGDRSERRQRRRTSDEDAEQARRRDRARRSSIEDADQALRRQSESELFSEIVASGALAASVTAAATVAKAQIEATTQRRKDTLEAETQRRKIASDERVAGFQAMRPQSESTTPDDA